MEQSGHELLWRLRGTQRDSETETESSQSQSGPSITKHRSQQQISNKDNKVQQVRHFGHYEDQAFRRYFEFPRINLNITTR